MPTPTLRYSDALADAHALIGAAALRLDAVAHPDSLFNEELVRVMGDKPLRDWVRLVRALSDIADVLSRMAAQSSEGGAADTLRFAVEQMRDYSKKFEPGWGNPGAEDS